MKATTVLCLLLAGAFGVSALPDPKVFCNATGPAKPGGWKVVVGAGANDTVSGDFSFDYLLGMAVEDWEADGNALPCMEPLLTPEIVCEQVGVGVTYKVYFTAECVNELTAFEATILIPLYEDPEGSTGPEVKSVKQVFPTKRRRKLLL